MSFGGARALEPWSGDRIDNVIFFRSFRGSRALAPAPVAIRAPPLVTVNP